nr:MULTISPECIES: hypothetical protein [unclassified Blastococcus]
MAESALVTKKVTMRIIAPIPAITPPGRVSSRANSCCSVAWPASPAPSCSARMPAPPNTENHSPLTSVGTASTPTTNSRMVRPREMRAMNVATNGDQEIHHAQ